MGTPTANAKKETQQQKIDRLNERLGEAADKLLVVQTARNEAESRLQEIEDGGDECGDQLAAAVVRLRDLTAEVKANDARENDKDKEIARLALVVDRLLDDQGLFELHKLTATLGTLDVRQELLGMERAQTLFDLSVVQSVEIGVLPKYAKAHIHARDWKALAGAIRNETA